MTDTRIKGSGNSRFFKGPPNFLTMFPDYQSFGQAVAAGEVPFDFGPLNPAGCKQIGDSLNKENLLKDSTAALYGKPATAVPDDILAAIKALIDTTNEKATGVVVLTGSYTGKGGKEHTFLCPGIKPRVLLVVSEMNSSYQGVSSFAVAINSVRNTYAFRSSYNSYVSPAETSFSWSVGSVIAFGYNGSNLTLDSSGFDFYWAIIGTKV